MPKEINIKPISLDYSDTGNNNNKTLLLLPWIRVN